MGTFSRWTSANTSGQHCHTVQGRLGRKEPSGTPQCTLMWVHRCPVRYVTALLSRSAHQVPPHRFSYPCAAHTMACTHSRKSYTLGHTRQQCQTGTLAPPKYYRPTHARAHTRSHTKRPWCTDKDTQRHCLTHKRTGTIEPQKVVKTPQNQAPATAATQTWFHCISALRRPTTT